MFLQYLQRTGYWLTRISRLLQYIKLCGYCRLVGLGGLVPQSRTRRTGKISNLLRVNPNKFQVADVHCLAECEIGKAGVAQEASAKKKRIEVFPKLQLLTLA